MMAEKLLTSTARLGYASMLCIVSSYASCLLLRKRSCFGKGIAEFAIQTCLRLNFWGVSCAPTPRRIIPAGRMWRGSSTGTTASWLA